MTTTETMSTTITDQYNAMAGTARTATQKSVELWKQGAQNFSEQASKLGALPKVDVVQGVEKYFEYVQRTVDANREFAATWAELVRSMSGVVRDQVSSVGNVVVDQTSKVADLATAQAEKVEQAAREQAAQADEAAKEVARAERAAERKAAKEAHEKAREPYEGKTKAELSELLAERELPKTGNLDELVERLVEADAQ